MYYRLTHTLGDKVEQQEFPAEARVAEVKAKILLLLHHNEGKVLIERKRSNYYGDFSFYLAITRSGDSGRPVHEVPIFYPFNERGEKMLRHLEELSPFKEFFLSKELSAIKRLIWICRAKKGMFKGSKVLTDFDLERDHLIRVIKGAGIPFSEIVEKATKYECRHELLN